MATKKCPNGHQYDPSIYGDNCPFCPSMAAGANSEKTAMLGGGNDAFGPIPAGGDFEAPTMRVNGGRSADAGGRTVIRSAGADAQNDERRLVGLLVSYDTNKNGDVFKIFEGRNIIGRAATCDIPITADSKLSSQHLLILFREDGFTAVDQYSTNGSYINGEFLSEGKKLKTGDIIVVGATKFVFFAIPVF